MKKSYYYLKIFTIATLLIAGAFVSKSIANENFIPTHFPHSFIKVTKIVCPNESDLPGWNREVAINSTTATEFLESHEQCHLEPDWQFQSVVRTEESLLEGIDPGGAFIGGAPEPWVDFPSLTDENGMATMTIDLIENVYHVFIRENLKEGYIPFAAPENPESNISAELYCGNDSTNNTTNNDNIEILNAPFKSGETYYCVAFNAPIQVTHIPQCSDGIDNNDQEDVLIDSADPACHLDKNVNNPGSYTPLVDNESNTSAQCSDGISNDNDNLVDSNDPGCHSDGDINNPNSWNPDDNDETNDIIVPTDEGGGRRRRGGGGGSSGNKITTSTGQVLGASTDICSAVETYMRKGYKNDKDQVKILQSFLNTYMKSNLKIDGDYGAKTELAVRSFQSLRKENVLTPWKLVTPTGIFYKTSLVEAKRLMCPDAFGTLPIPSDLTPWSKNATNVPTPISN